MVRGSIRTNLDDVAYDRDDHACVDCGRIDGIEAHHIIPDLESLDNLITLCHACHKKRHDMAGCFEPGNDIRRDTQAGRRNLIKANYNGHPFWGNQHTLKT